MKRRRDRVLFVLEKLPRYRLPLFNHLADRCGLELTVLHGGYLPEGLDVRGNGFAEIVAPQRLCGPFRCRRGLPALSKKFDVVVAAFNVRHLASVAFSLREERPALVWWGMGFGRHRLVHPLRVRLARRGEALLLYTHRARAQFARCGLPPEQVFVAPNTVHVAAPLLNTEASTRTHFLSIGRLQRRKRLEKLLAAFARALPVLPPHTALDIVGDGPQGAVLRSEVRRRGLGSRVTFHGALFDEARLRPLFARALATVSPGQAGLSVLHSFAHGVPFITQVDALGGGETANIVHGKNGFFVDGSAGALAEKLVYLATQPEEAVRMGRAAHAHYTRRRTMAHMAEGFVAAMQHALRARRREPASGLTEQR